MEKIENVICRNVYDFFTERTDKIDLEKHGFSGPKQFLARIQYNINDAIFAFTQIMKHDMTKNYQSDYLVGSIIDKDIEIYKMFDIDNGPRYFYIDADSLKPIEIKWK